MEGINLIDIKLVRENPDFFKKAATDKKIKFDLDRLLSLDNQLRQERTEYEELLSKRNKLSKMMGMEKDEESRAKIRDCVLEIKPEIEKIEAKLRETEKNYNQLLLFAPQPAREDVPVGRDDQDNVEILRWGKPPVFDFKAQDHMALGLSLGLIDSERGVKIAGSRSYVLTGLGARLEQAVLRLGYDHLCRRQYEAMSVPVLVLESAMEGTGYFPTGRDQAYCVEKDGLALVGTGEVSLTSFHSNEVLDEKNLPRRLMTQSTCFRREAGTYGKDTHGLYRVHQFQKIEQVILCKADAEESEKLHEELLKNATDLVELLELPYRIVYVCTGDLGQGQLRKHDIETWMPSRNSYSETHSCSSFHEFQARRLNIRYRDPESGKLVFCHTLNNTAIATPRAMIPLLEVHQLSDGRVKIPLALQPYLDGLTHIEPKK